MNAACQDCHQRARHPGAGDGRGWLDQASLTGDQKGAKVSKEDVPTLVSYLVRTHGPLPDGPAKKFILNTCTQCHDPFRIKANRRSPEEWEETLISMRTRARCSTTKSSARVHQYLSRNFGIE
jgi:hypothetical protein